VDLEKRRRSADEDDLQIVVRVVGVVEEEK
jgi:hypothetical protein